MNNLHPEKRDCTHYLQLFRAIDNVEKAIQQITKSNTQTLQEINSQLIYWLHSIPSLRLVLKHAFPEDDFTLFMVIRYHLRKCEEIIKYLWKEDSLQVELRNIYFLIYQAKIELYQAGLQPLFVRKEETFEEYIQHEISKTHDLNSKQFF